MNTLFLIWRSNKNNKWYPIGKLSNGEQYTFEYIQGALVANEECGFQPLDQFPSFDEKFESLDLFPLFTNRILSKNRPEFHQFIESLNLHDNRDDPIAILGRSGGLRETDYYELFPLPQPDETGAYHLHFFVRGISHLPKSSLDRILQLQPNERLLVMHDYQNKYDENAMLLRTDDRTSRFNNDLHIIGYLPQYLTSDIVSIKEHKIEPFEVRVERVNHHPAPSQFRILCNFTAKWPPAMKPFSSSLYNPVSTKTPCPTHVLSV